MRAAIRTRPLTPPRECPVGRFSTAYGGAFLAIQISLAVAVMEIIVRKPACLRVLHNILKGVWSPPIRTGPSWWCLYPIPLLEETRADDEADTFLER
ncbi:jg26584 [Pararge aegeria aegeria]|uniref:Jg26584 protein n=1 Tax=Pararge aegeria aegeria TaxID=348720 RepID=A0A8S4QWU7_9NEOP|nr:jg26584 [Pararge aegeria aegeria]